jgi:hypothetical protein
MTIVKKKLSYEAVLVESNNSIFDEENSLFITERSWNIGTSLVDKKKQKELVEVL